MPVPLRKGEKFLDNVSLGKLPHDYQNKSASSPVEFCSTHSINDYQPSGSWVSENDQKLMASEAVLTRERLKDKNFKIQNIDSKYSVVDKS